MMFPFDVSAEIERSQHDEKHAINDVLHATEKLVRIKAKTGFVTSAGTRLASIATTLIHSGKLTYNGLSKQSLLYLAYATFDTLMREDIEGGIMDKSGGDVESIILYMDHDKQVPTEAVEVLKKRFSASRAELMGKFLQNALVVLKDLVPQSKPITSAFGKSGLADPLDQILGKMWKADWANIADRLLNDLAPTDGAKQLISDMHKQVSENIDKRLSQSLTAEDFKERKEVLTGAYEAAKLEEDDADDDEISVREVESELRATEDVIKAKVDDSKEPLKPNVLQQQMIDRIKLYAHAISKNVLSHKKELQHLNAVPVPNGILIYYNMKYPMPWDKDNCIDSGLNHAILIPITGLIADAVYLTDNGYKVVDGVFDVLNHAFTEGKSAANMVTLARQRLSAIYRPHASAFVAHAAVIVTKSKRMPALENELYSTFANVLEDGWDIISLSSPNTPASIWAPRVGFEHTISANGGVVLKKVSATSRVTEYELRSNPLARFTDPKRCTTSLWAASPDVTDKRTKIRFNVRMSDGKLLGGITDGIQPLIMFASSETVKGFYPLLRSNNPTAGVHEDAYLINADYFSTLRRADDTPVNGVVKISIARNKGLTISTYYSTLKVSGANTNIELIARNDNSRENKLTTQLLSAARLAAEMLGFKQITLREGFEMQVLEALIRECKAQLGFDPLDATVTFKGVDGQIHTVQHVVVGRYQALVDVSQRYTAHVAKYGATFKYFSALNVAKATMPEFVKLAQVADSENSTRARFVRALKNLQKQSFVAKSGIRYVSLNEAANMIAKNQLLTKQLYNTFDDSVFDGFIFVKPNGGKKVTNLHAPKMIFADVSKIATIVGYDKLQLSELDENIAQRLTIAFGDNVIIPIGQDRNGRWVVMKIRLVAPAPVSVYTDANNVKHYVLTKEFKEILGLIAYMRSKSELKRQASTKSAVGKLVTTMKGAAYYYAKHPSKIAAIKGRVATKVNGHEDGFTIGKWSFLKLINNESVLRLLGLNKDQQDKIFGMIGELTTDHTANIAEVRQLKATVEQMRVDNELDARIPIIAQRSPTLNYLGFGFLEDLTGAEVVGIPHKHGLRMAADDDGDPVTLMIADKVYKSFFDVLGEGTSTSRR